MGDASRTIAKRRNTRTNQASTARTVLAEKGLLEQKIKMTFTELFKIILTFDKDRSREAARKIRKLLYSSRDSGEYKDTMSIIENAPAEYIKIIEDWRRENFVMAISVMYFLHSRENRPDFLFPWLFQLLQHKNGNIRHSAVRMVRHELGPLTYHIRLPGEKISPRELSPEQADHILFGLHTNLNNLAAGSWNPSYKKFKYIGDLPSGTYKSVQLVLSLLNDYCSDVTDQEVQVEKKEEILVRRKEIEQDLVDMLIDTQSNFSLQDVKGVIYNEEDNDDMMEVIAMFDRGGDASELSDVLDLVTDAWNYFPHKALKGLSPADLLAESSA